MDYLQVVVVIPEVPGFAGDIKAESAIKTIMAAQYRSMNHGGSSLYEEVRKAGYEPYVIFDSSSRRIFILYYFRMDYIRFLLVIIGGCNTIVNATTPRQVSERYAYVYHSPPDRFTQTEYFRAPRLFL